LCTDCRRPQPVEDLLARRFEAHDLAPPESVYGPEGCAACNETGFRGRTGLYEVLVVDDDLEKLIASGAGPGEIRAAARERGSRSVTQAGFAKVARGITSLTEVERVAVDAV
ncbi:MAG: type II/IV secretion system protein, partial [Acidobacteriota bacterium]